MHSAPQGRDVAHEGQPPRDTGARPPGPEFLLAAAAGGGGFDICRESPPCLALIISRLTADFCSMIQAAGNASAGAAFQERGGFSSTPPGAGGGGKSVPWTQPLTSAAPTAPGYDPNPTPSGQTTPKPLWFPTLFKAGGAAWHEAEYRVGTSHRQLPSLLLQPWLDASPNPPWP